MKCMKCYTIKILASLQCYANYCAYKEKSEGNLSIHTFDLQKSVPPVPPLRANR